MRVLEGFFQAADGVVSVGVAVGRDQSLNRHDGDVLAGRSAAGCIVVVAFA